MKKKKIEAEEVLKDNNDFIETEDLMIAKNADKNGAYIAHLKSASIIKAPEDEYEREELFQQSMNDLDRFIATLRNLKPA